MTYYDIYTPPQYVRVYTFPLKYSIQEISPQQQQKHDVT